MRIILMTATQPLIFDKDQVRELFDEYQVIPDRVTLSPNLNKISISEFSDKINNLIQEYSDKNILIIMNTISSSVFIFDHIITNQEKYYLSASIVPAVESERIKFISKNLEEGKRTILVSTQVVEAGIDFDFDIVIRDLAPIDSIIQAAGRCNRNGKKSAKESIVFIFAVLDNNGRLYANKIYGETLIDKSRETLSTNETNISKLVEIYYHKIKESGTSTISKEIITNIIELNYESIEKNFKLIEDQPTVSVFIEINEKAENVWKEYKSIVSSSSAEDDRRRNLRQFFLKKRDIFYSFIVNTWQEVVDKLSIPYDEPFYYVKRNLIEKYYNYVTGLHS